MRAAKEEKMKVISKKEGRKEHKYTSKNGSEAREGEGTRER